MKKILIVLAVFLTGAWGYAQRVDFPKNEVKLNILNAIAIASIEVGYERFFTVNQSVEAEVFINDRFSYIKKGETFKTHSFKLGYNYYFDLDGLSGPFVNPFIKQRFGSFEEDGKTMSMNSFILGIGVGYVWNYNDTFIVAPYANIGRNFGKEVNEHFWAIEPNAGIRIGYRF